VITEQQQREAYEFIRSELKGRKWAIDEREFGKAPLGRWDQKGLHYSVILPPLYTNGQPDYNTWMREFVRRLLDDGVICDYAHWIWTLMDAKNNWPYSNSDPYAAFSQRREAKSDDRKG